MKKGLIFATFLLVTAGLFGQNTFKYEVRVPSLRVGGATKVKVDSVTVSGDTIKFFTGATELLPKGYGTGGSMTYPGSGIALSTGSAWGTSITNNSDNWNTAYNNRVMSASGTAPLNLSLSSNALTGSIDAATTSTAGTMSAADKLKLDHLRDSLTAALNERIGAGSSLSELAPLLADTIPLFVFGLGSGVAADTAVFNDNAIAGAFYNAGSDTLMITSLHGVLAEGSGTESVSVQVSWHATFKSDSATNLNSSALAVTSLTTGTTDTSFANSTIPPGVWVWCTISGLNLGNRPSLLILTMSGYKQNRSY